MRFEKQLFTTEVTLDYNEFVDCEFRGCIIHYHGGAWSFANVKMTNVRYVIKAQAHATLTFLKFLRSVDPALLEQLLSQEPQAGEIPAPVLN